MGNAGGDSAKRAGGLRLVTVALIVPASSTPSTASMIARSVLIGGSTGLRSQMGMAMLVNGTPKERLPTALRHPAVRGITVVAALTELVADKLPSTPPRTQARGLVPRIGLGGLSAGLLARSMGAPTGSSAAVGAAAALGAAFAGMAARQAVAKRLPPMAAAIVEDFVAVLLAVLAIRPGPTTGDDVPADAASKTQSF
jgi:uncharacterized membrane protein